MDTDRVILAYCWRCKAPFHAESGIGLEGGEKCFRSVRSGDRVLCMTCGSPGVYEDGQLRRPTSREILAIALAMGQMMEAKDTEAN